MISSYHSKLRPGLGGCGHHGTQQSDVLIRDEKGPEGDELFANGGIYFFSSTLAAYFMNSIDKRVWATVQR